MANSIRSLFNAYACYLKSCRLIVQRYANLLKIIAGQRAGTLFYLDTDAANTPFKRFLQAETSVAISSIQFPQIENASEFTPQFFSNTTTFGSTAVHPLNLEVEELPEFDQENHQQQGLTEYVHSTALFFFMPASIAHENTNYSG